jgi:hypothetical protein
MNKSTDLLDPCYPELSKLMFRHRMNHYKKIITWLVVVNIVGWSAVAYIVTKSLSV